MDHTSRLYAMVLLVTITVGVKGVLAQESECEVVPPQLRTEVCVELQPMSEFVLAGIKVIDKSEKEMRGIESIKSFDPDRGSFVFTGPLIGDTEINLASIGRIEFSRTPVEQSPLAQEAPWEVRIHKGKRKTITVPARKLRIDDRKLVLRLEEIAPLPTDGRVLEVKSIVFDASRDSFSVDIQHATYQVHHFGGGSGSGVSGIRKGTQ